MGVESNLVSLWKAEIRELAKEDTRKAKVAEVSEVLTGKTRTTTVTEGYTYGIVDWLKDEEHAVNVLFYVVSTREPRSVVKPGYGQPPKAIATKAFLAVAEEILRKTYKNLQPYVRILSTCSDCDEIRAREYGFVIEEENTVVYVYVEERYPCQCKN